MPIEQKVSTQEILNQFIQNLNDWTQDFDNSIIAIIVSTTFIRFSLGTDDNTA